MLFSIDAVFLNGDLEVIDIRSNLKPWRVASCRGARAVLELAAGEAERRGVEIGDRLLVLGAPPKVETDLADLFERVGAMLADDFPGPGGQYAWADVEALLSEGYAQTLALEAERGVIERRLAEQATARWRNAWIRSLAARLEAIERDILCLRALLAELYDHGSHLREPAMAFSAA
jgi:hypothetical protein